jgi:hypothetical protein
MGLAVKLIEDDSLRVTPDGYEVQVRLNWYRSIPLSCVEQVRVALNGRWAEPDAIDFGVNGRRHTLAALAEMPEDSWFVNDSATLHISAHGAATAGAPHTVEVELAFRVPYIQIGPEMFLVRADRLSTTMIAR